MYNFSYFKEKDKLVLLDFMANHPFAFLTGSDSTGKQVATQLPLLLEQREGEWYLQGHIMRNTDHHKAFIENSQVMAVFTGPHCYVSATWYTNPISGSTWNYMSIQIKGDIEFRSEEWLMNFMQKLTLKFENNDKASPTVFNNLPKEYHDRMMPAIIGFEIKVEQMENVFKLSQNQDQQSYKNIIARLNEQGGNAAQVAVQMQNRFDQLFTVKDDF